MKTIPILAAGKANHQRASSCKKCGGDCCKGMPGIAFPEDFAGLTTMRSPVRQAEVLLAALATGRWAIDWWEGDPTKDESTWDGEGRSRAYFMRPATKGREGQWFDPSWGGECTFLGARGCSLSHDSRPLECRMLEPAATGFPQACQMHGEVNKRTAAIAWLKYERVIEAIHEDHDAAVRS